MIGYIPTPSISGDHRRSSWQLWYARNVAEEALLISGTAMIVRIAARQVNPFGIRPR